MVLNFFNTELINIKVDQEFRDSKTELQELLQSKKLKPPVYETSESARGFDCEIKLLEGTFIANGNSKRQAEIAAAKMALTQLKNKNV